MTIRTRFAPSPTGELHLGNARTAVLNWLYARHTGGRFILRTEDTDPERTVPGAEEEILRGLRWLGLDWDEGPAVGGPHGPYRQSERISLYRDFAARLIERGAAYYCYCTPAVLSEKRRAALQRGVAPRYDGTCRSLDPDEERRLREAAVRPSIRFRGRSGTVQVLDLLKGELEFDAEAQGDFVIMRSDGGPTYNFAAVVDDLVMEITHVIRGIGHLANTPRQVLLYEALGAEPPVFVHIPHVLSPDGEPLSKRRGARTLAEYEREGYHPDAVLNYLSLLSWSSPTGEEILERDRLVREIDLARLGASDVRIDPQKLRWLSGKHIQRMPTRELAARLAEFAGAVAAETTEETWREIAEATRDRLTTFAEIRELLPQFFPQEPLAYPDEIAETLSADDARAVLDSVADALERAAWTREGILQAVKDVGRARKLGGRALYRPIRLALTGHEHGPELVDIIRIQGRDRAVRILRRAAARATTGQRAAGKSGAGGAKPARGPGSGAE